MAVTRTVVVVSKRARTIIVSAVVISAAAGIGVVSAGWRSPSNTERASGHAALPVAVVYKDPNCGCCRAWVEQMRAAGFGIEVHDVAAATERDAFNRAHGITGALAACHTAIIGGYVVEGHVPPELVVRMLTEHPKIAGLAVPGMPMGAPGMEGMGSEHYDVLAFTGEGATHVYAKR
jgi:hypothetical protein